MKDFIDEAKILVNRGVCKTMKEAMKRVRSEQPGLHEAWLKNQPKVKLTKEGRRVS